MTLKPSLAVLLCSALHLTFCPRVQAIPGGSPLINLPSINDPAFVDNFEGQPLGAAPLGWAVPQGVAAVGNSDNHSPLGSQSVTLQAAAGTSAQIRRPLPAGTKGISVAIDPGTVPFGANVSLSIQYATDTYTYQSLYDFSDGAHEVDAGLGLEFDGTVTALDFSDWNVFDYDVTPQFDPLLGIMVSPDCDHGTQITFWSHGRSSPQALAATSMVEVIITLTSALDAPDVMVHVDDLKTYNQQIIALVPPSADFNHDGQVDGLDLIQWQGDFGSSPESDADLDGDSDGADFLIWQRQTGGPASSEVAEPNATILSAILLVVAPAARWTKLRYPRPRANSVLPV